MSNLRKACAVSQIKADDAGTFTGYASTFGTLDLGGDIVVKGAYADTLQRRGARGIKMLFDHNPSDPIGAWEEMAEDEIGLRVKGRLLLDLQKGREVHAMMKAGIIDGLSIGYRVEHASRDAGNGARLLEKVDLREVSVVTFPMNESSLISSVKGELPTEREFERWLMQDAGFTRSQARQIITGGFKSLLTAKPGAGEEAASSGATDWAAISRQLAALQSTLTT